MKPEVSPQKSNVYTAELDGAVYETAVRIISRKRASRRLRVLAFLLVLALAATLSYELYSAFQSIF